MSDPNKNEDELIAELEKIGQAIDSEIEIANATEQSFVELKQEDFQPIYDEFYGSRVVGEFVFVDLEEKGAKKRLKDPKGGLTAAGRAHFKRKEGANLKPGVKGPADTPEKMRRKGSFLTRFFTNPSGPLKDEKGRATRLALSAAAWGEPVPGDAEAAARLAAKGRRLLERYANTKKKSIEEDEEIQIKALGQSIGQMAGSKPSSNEAIDHDMDGMIFDGTPQEQRKPYAKGKDSLGRNQGMDYEKRRRAYVRQELARQGIKRNKGPKRTEAERLARTRARARFDDIEFQKSRTDDQGRMGPGGGPKKSPYVPGKPADRYKQPDGSFEKNEQRRQQALRKETSSERAERQRQERMKPADTSSQRAEDARNRAKRPQKPVDRLSGAQVKPDGSSERAEQERMERLKPKPKRAPGQMPNRVKPKQKPVDRLFGAKKNPIGPSERAENRRNLNKNPKTAKNGGYKPGYILDNNGELHDYQGKAPKGKPHIREGNNGELYEFDKNGNLKGRLARGEII